MRAWILRTCVAAGVAALLAVSAVRPHVHDASTPDHADAPCAVCQLRSAEPARDLVLDLAPAVVPASEPLPPVGLPPVTGAPLGAVPGQSPPAAA
jgi:hypothetical protein